MDQKKALGNLVTASNVLADLKVRHFLSDGTLLGAVREKNFIEHDSDLDIGVIAEDLQTYEKLGSLIYWMLENGFELRHIFGHLTKHFEITFMRKEIKLDMFFFFKVGDKRRHHAFQNGFRNGESDIITYEYPAEIVENLSPIDFLYNVFPAPRMREEFLKIKYGPEWRTPVKSWDWRFGPRNVVHE